MVELYFLRKVKQLQCSISSKKCTRAIFERCEAFAFGGLDFLSLFYQEKSEIHFIQEKANDNIHNCDNNSFLQKP